MELWVIFVKHINICSAWLYGWAMTTHINNDLYHEQPLDEHVLSFTHDNTCVLCLCVCVCRTCCLVPVGLASSLPSFALCQRSPVASISFLWTCFTWWVWGSIYMNNCYNQKSNNTSVHIMMNAKMPLCIYSTCTYLLLHTEQLDWFPCDRAVWLIKKTLKPLPCPRLLCVSVAGSSPNTLS